MIVASSPQLLHAHLGAPRVADCAPLHAGSSCWVCGGTACPRGMDAAAFCGDKMTDQTQCRDQDATHVCEACIYLRARSSPVPGRLPGPCSRCGGSKVDPGGGGGLKALPGVKRGDLCGKCEGSGRNALGGNFRCYSHLFDEEGSPVYITASKAEKPVILAWLRAPKRGRWFAAIADSGQKQVLPYAPLNLPGGRGRVVFDDVTVNLPAAAGWALVDAMAAFLTAGATKDEIASGDYQPWTWARCTDAIRAFEAAWGSVRGGAWFSLALWLAQRNEDEVRARQAAEATAQKGVAKGKRNANQRRTTRKAPNTDCRSAPRNEDTSPEGEGRPDHPLEHTTKPGAQRRSAKRDP